MPGLNLNLSGNIVYYAIYATACLYMLCVLYGTVSPLYPRNKREMGMNAPFTFLVVYYAHDHIFPNITHQNYWFIIYSALLPICMFCMINSMFQGRGIRLIHVEMLYMSQIILVTYILSRIVQITGS